MNDLRIVKKKECYLYCRLERAAGGGGKVSQRIRKYFDLSAGMNGHSLGVGNRFMQSKLKKHVGRRYEGPRYRQYGNERVSVAAKKFNEKGVNANALRLSQYVKHHLKGIFIRNRLLDEDYLPMLVHPSVYEKFILGVRRSAAVIELLSGLERFECDEEVAGGNESDLRNEDADRRKNKEQNNCFIISDLLLYIYLDSEGGPDSLKRLDSGVLGRTMVVLEHGFPEFYFLEHFKPSLIVTGVQAPFGMGGYRLVFYKNGSTECAERMAGMESTGKGSLSDTSLSDTFEHFLLGRGYISPGVGLFCGSDHPMWCGMSLWLYKEGLEYYYRKKKLSANSWGQVQFKAIWHRIKRLECGDVDRRRGNQWLKITRVSERTGRVFAWITIKSALLDSILNLAKTEKSEKVEEMVIRASVRSLERVLWVKKDVWRCFTKRGSILCLKTHEAALMGFNQRLMQTGLKAGDHGSERERAERHEAAATEQNAIPIYTLVLNIPIITEENHLKKPLAELVLWMEELKAAMTNDHSSF